MKIKLATSSEDFLYVSTVNRTHVYENEENNEQNVVAHSVLSITIENATEELYEKAINFFDKKNIDSIFIYNNLDNFVTAFSNLTVQSVSQSFSDERNVIYISLSVNL